jgi:S-DNA-T family DNA segregation ATPase FtsK/SpoIIIE
MSSNVRRASAVSSRRGSTPSGTRLREVFGIVALAFGLFLVTALLSLQFGSGQLMGPLGRFFAHAAWALAGCGAYLVASALIVGPVRVLSGRRPIESFTEGGGFVLGLLSLAVLLHLVGDGYRVDGLPAGGRLGEGLAEIMRAGVSTAGTALFATAGLFLAIVALTPIEIRQVGAAVGHGAQVVWSVLRLVGGEAARWIGEVVRAILPEPGGHDGDAADGESDRDDEDDGRDRRRTTTRDTMTDAAPPSPVVVDGGGKGRKRNKKPAEIVADAEGDADADLGAAPTELIDGDTVRVGEPLMDPIIVEPKRKKKRPTELDAAGAAAVLASTEAATVIVDETLAASAAPPPAAIAKATAAPNAIMADGPARTPQILEPSFHKESKKDMKEKEKAVAEHRPDFIPLGDGVYRLPSISLLKYDDAGVSLDKNAMLELSARLVKTLADYGVRGEVQAIRPGPVVTMYEFVPAPGTRVSKIANLSDDLAMALEAVAVRIVAPIPGKAAVGIEVPNKLRETVYLKEIIADDVFQKAKSKLSIALGKDIEGRPVAVDLAKMPHLLVAGTTGSGKSVSVNGMISSLLFNATPEEVRMIMVDPKMLELSIYEGIPHLLLPVVTDPKKANLALRWAVEEMERRYQLLAQAGVREIVSYNRKVEKLLAGGADKIEVETVGDGGEPTGTIFAEIEAGPGGPSGPGGPAPEPIGAEGSGPQLVLKAKAEAPPRKLPYIVIVIDEFADLMMVAPKDIETSVARIAQKARAAGIHLILATQRPSVDVITGLIKANFPSRIAFKVVQRNDSRTILDQNGAEALLGQGDMLFSDRGGALRRVHGCLVQDEEIHSVVAHLKKQAKPVYDMDIIKPRDDDDGGGEAPPEEDLSDDMYDRAVALVAETRQASISMIQRRLRVGYNRAARMVERMEKEGIVGPPDGTNRREVLISPAA